MSWRSSLRVFRRVGNLTHRQYPTPVFWKPSTSAQLWLRSTVSTARDLYQAEPGSSYEVAALNEGVVAKEQSKDAPPVDRSERDTTAASLLSACPGCGALAQTVEQNEAGYYTLRRKVVKDHLDHIRGDQSQSSVEENAVFNEALARASAVVTAGLNIPTIEPSGMTSSRRLV